MITHYPASDLDSWPALGRLYKLLTLELYVVTAPPLNYSDSESPHTRV